MKHSSLAVRVALLIVNIVALTALVQAQYRTSIQGVVTDATGAVVPGATLTLTNPATGEKQVRVSGGDGVFNFNALPAAKFRLEAEKTGFEKKVLNNVQVIPEQANALTVVLAAGAESTTVNVNAESAPLLDTETASINGVVSDNQIQHLPSFGRDVLKLAQLAPGSFADGSQGGGGQQYYNLPGVQSGASQSGGSTGIFATENLAPIFSNGNQVENNGISIDGISTTSAVWGGSTVITPSEDSVDNVKIVSNSYDAESGRFSGSQIQITSKSGTNDFHGSLFFTAHQPGLNAYQPFFGLGTVSLRDNNKFDQFGGSVGGPIWKNKIFFFFNYETVREPNASITGSGWYDTPAFDALAPAGSIAATYLTFPGNGAIGTVNPNGTCATAGLQAGVNCANIPGQGINVGTPLTTGLGTQDLGWTSVTNPGCGGAGTGCGTPGSPFGTIADIALYNTVNPTKFNAAQYNGRLDADFTSKDRIAFAIYWVPQSITDYNGNRAYDLFHRSQINDAFSAIWDHTFSPTLLNEARVNAAGWRYNDIASNPQSPVGLPVDNIGMIGSITPGEFGPPVGAILNQWTYTYKDVATKIIGRNTIKFGGEVTRLFYLQDNPSAGVPSYFFFNMWDFLNDAPHEESGSFNPHTGIPTTVRQDDREDLLGFFVQDDLKIRPNLTLNLGLRWSYFGPLSSKEGNMYVATPGNGPDYLTGLDVHLGHSWNAQKDNFGPEIGFAWSPTRFNDRLVFRGGFGLNYNQEEIAVSSNIVSNPGLAVSPSLDMSAPSSPNPGIYYATSNSVHNLYGFPSNPNTISTFGPNGLPSSGGNVEIFPNTLPTMRGYHYSLDMQYDLGHQYIMSLGYQGSLSRDIFFHEDPRAVPAAVGYTVPAQITGGDYWNTNGYGNYNAMLAELKHQFSHQFMVDAQYTWAKSMDTSSAPYSLQYYPYDLDLDYGRSDYNVTNAFKLFGMWQPVFFHGSNNWLEKIAGGWSLSGIWNWHSGFPWNPVVSVVGGDLYCGTCYAYGNLLPAAYLGGAGTSSSNKSFELPSSSNFPLAATQGNANAYFATPTYTAYSGSSYGSALPQSPGIARNSLTEPGYKDLDLTIAKGFGLPKAPVLGESARLELRMDVYNVFNNLNLNPNNSISNNIGNSNFGTISSALAARVVVLEARFSF
jgi:Carboxypeptidase regulatory-like domain